MPPSMLKPAASAVRMAVAIGKPNPAHDATDRERRAGAHFRMHCLYALAPSARPRGCGIGFHRLLIPWSGWRADSIESVGLAGSALSSFQAALRRGVVALRLVLVDERTATALHGLEPSGLQLLVEARPRQRAVMAEALDSDEHGRLSRFRRARAERGSDCRCGGGV